MPNGPIFVKFPVIFPPGVSTSHLRVERFWWTIPLDEDGQAPLALPAVPLNPAAFTEWAHMQMARGRRCAAFVIDAKRPAEPAPASVSALPSPFIIPVARLIHEAKFGAAADQGHLAEVLLSGLVFAKSPGDPDSDPQDLYYDFYPEARAILLRSLREADAESIALALQQRVSQYIEQIYGRAVTFRALVRDRAFPASRPGCNGSSSSQVTRRPIRRIGGMHSGGFVWRAAGCARGNCNAAHNLH